MIDHDKDFDNQFFRSVTISLAKTLNKQIRWINRFDDQTIRVFLPFYTSLTGDERFNLDAFVDDVVDKRINLNTDQYQRGVITFNGFGSRSDEFANPNQYLSKKASIDGKLRKIISKVKAVPVSINYDIEIQLATANEVDKCSQKLMDVLYNYFFFNFDYYGLKIDGFFLLPDDKGIEIPRDITMDSDRKKTIKFSLEVKTYYPIFRITTDDLIPCDNDNNINWDELDIPRPSTEFIESLKKYNEHFGQTNYVGGGNGEDKEGLTAIRKVYWRNFYYNINDDSTEVNNKTNHPKNWGKENL